MKIGIITFHRAKNYGAVLQTYALQKKIEHLGAQCEIIDYVDNEIDNNYKFFNSLNIKKIIRDIIYFPFFYKKYKKFDIFIKNKLVLTPKVYFSKKDSYEELNFDKYITGSDQVWNYKLTSWDKKYFLDFVDEKEKKYSYAASFGMNKIPESQKEQYKLLLNKFNRISVREENGVDILSDIGISKDNVNVDIDPTLLLKKEEWKEIIKYPKEKNYVLVFVMQKNPSIFQFAEKLAKEKNCKIIYISDSLKRRVKAKYKYSVSPEEWLGYFENAKYIVTNSFHGLAFSINLNKDFFVELQREPATGNARLESLLKICDLENRKIANCDNKYIDEQINWLDVNKKLDECRKKSEVSLKEIIK